MTCACERSDEVPLCLVVTCDFIASLRVDFSECLSIIKNETSVVRCSEGHTGVGGKDIPEFPGDNDGPLQGSVECAGESLELFGARTLAERVMPKVRRTVDIPLVQLVVASRWRDAGDD